jgi:alpha-glucoside transport system permease protein
MKGFFTWLTGLPQVAQIAIVIVVFLAVVALIVFFVEIAPRSGSFILPLPKKKGISISYTVVRLIVAIGVPVAVLAVLGLSSGNFWSGAFWVFLLAAVLGGGLFWLDYRSRSGAGYLIQLLLFISPAILLMLVGLVYPAVKTIISAFLANTSQDSFVGLDNFKWVFTSGTQGGLIAVINTLIWVIVVPLFTTAIGLVYAVLVDHSRHEKVLKVFIFMPMAISLVGASIIWKFFYYYQQGPQIGLLNQIMVWIGKSPVSWLQYYPLNMILLMVILIWSQTGYAMVLQSSAIKGVPAELIEASQLDGAGSWKRFWHIIIPQIKPTIIMVWVTVSITSLKVYDIIAATTGGQNNTTVLGYDMVTQFQLFPPQSGHSAALAVMIFILVIPFIIFNAHNLKKEREER